MPIRHDGMLARSLPQPNRVWIERFHPPYAGIWVPGDPISRPVRPPNSPLASERRSREPFGLRMHDSPAAPFLSGVIEGFYGPTWSRAERIELLDLMSAWGLHTYLQGPKDDIHHRAAWRTPYPHGEASELRSLAREANARGVQLAHGFGPGLDIRYSDPADLDAAVGRFVQSRAMGVSIFVLLFDDIPDRMHADDVARWGSLACAQAAFANAVLAALSREAPARMLFCPTPYCGRMAMRAHGGPGYLQQLGANLAPAIDVFWTGPEIVSHSITPDHLDEVASWLRRPPVLWDNLHANDYDGRRFHCGPYSGRPRAIRSRLRGVLSNPNTEFPLNFPGLHSLSAWLRSAGDWDERASYLEAIRAWLPKFDGWGMPMPEEDLVLLGDCFYLPGTEGPMAVDLRDRLRTVLATQPAHWGPEAAGVRSRLARLRDACARIADLRDRRMFAAWSRRAWELREETDLVVKFLDWNLDPATRGQPFHSDFHQPLTYRGGMVPSLQSLLSMQPDGTFTPGVSGTPRP